jgi:nitrite reductase/ring-hydroxylating ferredoxin subunit
MSRVAEWVALMPADRLGPGEMTGVEVGNNRLAVYNINGAFHVTDNVCTHAFALLTDGWLEDGVIECPLHGGRFVVATGQAITEPAEKALRTYPARVNDGVIEVQLSP